VSLLFLNQCCVVAHLQEECQKYGTVIKLTIPRPTTEQPHPVGLGLIMIEYTDMAAALKAKQAMHGRKFGGHTVEGTFLSETDYATGNFHSTAA
jgi:splicing factor U2AF subunit